MLNQGINDPVKELLRSFVSHVKNTLTANSIMNRETGSYQGNVQVFCQIIAFAVADDDVHADTSADLQHVFKIRIVPNNDILMSLRQSRGNDFLEFFYRGSSCAQGRHNADFIQKRGHRCYEVRLSIDNGAFT